MAAAAATTQWHVVQVDMYDRLPTPFGLVRGGVASDHQKWRVVVWSPLARARCRRVRGGKAPCGFDPSSVNRFRFAREATAQVGSAQESHPLAPIDSSSDSLVRGQAPKLADRSWSCSHPTAP